MLRKLIILSIAVVFSFAIVGCKKQAPASTTPEKAAVTAPETKDAEKPAEIKNAEKPAETKDAVAPKADAKAAPAAEAKTEEKVAPK